VKALESVTELCAWGLDSSVDRGDLNADDLRRALDSSSFQLRTKTSFADESPVLSVLAGESDPDIAARRCRVVSSGFFDAFDWNLAMVDLTKLVAFQRRVIFSTSGHTVDVSGEPLQLAFPESAPPRFDAERSEDGQSLTLWTGDPNFSVAVDKAHSPTASSFSLELKTGSPFIEVAGYRGRWFLRDGYHRAFMLLRAGVKCIPAVVFSVRSIEGLGACQPWFFDEAVLFARRPPLVMDFHDRALTVQYERPLRRKVIRVSVREEWERVECEDELEEEQMISRRME
jgi:hypothetical protein